MAFHKIRFPQDISLQSRGGPRRMTDVVTLVSGHEERNQRWANSRRTYDAAYGIKSKADMQQVLAFFEERRGRFHSFLWRDGVDFSSSTGNSAISALDEAIGVGDGATTAFQLTKTYGGAFDPFVRKIEKPDAQSVLIAIDSVDLPASEFEVDEESGVVTLDSPPTSGAEISAGFQFDVQVRFDTDRLDIDLTGFDSAMISSIPIIEVL